MLERTRPATREPKMPAATSTAALPLPSALCSLPLFNVVVCGPLAERAARLLHQVGLDEHVDVAVEHAVDVADLLLRPMVFHHLIRMQHVTADLAAEPDALL